LKSPLLKWAGGKRWFLNRFSPIWEASNSQRLVEPFCGGMAITLGVSPKNAILNDINSHLINFYKWVQKGLVFTIEMKNDREIFNNYRKDFNYLISNGEKYSKRAAEYFYYLNKTCFNGLCRFNKEGEFNVPYGKYREINYAKDFLNFTTILNKWQFTSYKFNQIRLLKTDFVFADPPYDTKFSRYTKYGFDWNDQVNVVKWLEDHKGPTIITNQATERIINLYKENGFALYYLKGPRSISANGNRKPADVVAAIKNLQLDHQIISNLFSQNNRLSI
jgi:DNA adenine methylase